MSFITEGKKEISFEGKKVARELKIWDNNGRLFLGEGHIQIVSDVIELNENNNVIIHKDKNPVSRIPLSQIPFDTQLKINPEATEFITFAQLFQAICDACDKIWGNQFKKVPKLPEIEEIEEDHEVKEDEYDYMWMDFEIDGYEEGYEEIV